MRHALLIPLAFLAALAAPALVSPVRADAPLAGWGKLSFGMTPDQVRAVKGMAWNDLVKLPVPGGLSTMDTKKTVSAFGVKATVRLTFDGASELVTIDLVSNLSLAAPACDAMTRKVLTAADSAYGPFAPDPKLVKADMGGVTYETAGANSRMVVQTSDSPDTGKTVISEARHASGPASVQVAVNLNEPPITEDGQKQAYLCEMHVLFNARP
jgi:hypothetical protein